MTWQELADFINNEMPKCNRYEEASVWDSGESGKYFNIYSITPYDSMEEPSKENFYSININAGDVFWD